MPSRGAPGPPLIGRAARCAIQSGGGGGPAVAFLSRLVSAPVPPWLPRAAAPPRRRRRARTSRWWCGAGRCGGSFLGGRWGPVRGQAPGWSRGGPAAVPPGLGPRRCPQCPPRTARGAGAAAVGQALCNCGSAGLLCAAADTCSGDRWLCPEGSLRGSRPCP